MTVIPRQKAKALYNYYDDLLNKDFMNPIVNHNQLIQCTLIAIDEILNELFEIALVTGSSYVHKHIDYYQEVKQEIEKL
jgi:hypothetical protein